MSKRAAQDARVLPTEELWPKRMEGAPWSDISRHFPAFLPPSHCFPAHFCPLLPGIARRLFIACLLTIARHCAAKNTAPEQVSAHRQPFSVGLTTSGRSSLHPSPSRLVPLRRTQHEPMLRKGNVLSCTNRGTIYLALTASLFSLRPSTWRRKMLESNRSAAMAGTSGWSRPTTGGPRPAYIKITRCDRLPVYLPARSREPTWREPRIVCAASQDTSTSQDTQRPRSEPPC